MWNKNILNLSWQELLFGTEEKFNEVYGMSRAQFYQGGGYYHTTVIMAESKLAKKQTKKFEYDETLVRNLCESVVVTFQDNY